MMKNSAKWELRVGLLLGLAFIIAFGMILSELRDPVAQPEAEKQIAVNTSYYKNTQLPLERETYQNIDPVAVAPRETPQEVRPVHVDMGDLQPATIRNADQIPTRPQPARPVRQQPQSKPYRVVDGDTLYEISEKAYGPGKGHMWRKIYEANRGTLSNPSAIRPGQTLVIPSLGQSVPAAVNDVSRQEALNHIRSYVADSSPAATAPTRNRNTSRARVHVVKSGDNLTRIARKYLKDTSSASINKIFEANRDQLRDPNDVTIGMKLRIPAN